MLTDPTNISPEEKSSYLKNRREIAEYNKVKAETYSLWCDILYKLSIANHFRDDIMYFPHNIDFRGRVYPIGKKHALKKYNQLALNTSCFLGRTRSIITPASCAISQKIVLQK